MNSEESETSSKFVLVVLYVVTFTSQRSSSILSYTPRGIDELRAYKLITWRLAILTKKMRQTKCQKRDSVRNRRQQQTTAKPQT